MREFGLAKVRSGSFASLRQAARLRRMSAMPSIATESVRRNEPTRRANNGRERVQQWMHQKAGYSITSSARASKVGGTSRPSALAVLRLTINSYLVGACTGRSAGFSPFRMRSTYSAAR